MVIPLFVGRPKSIKAMEIAMESGKSILLVAQKSATKDDPGPQDMYEVGCVSNILQIRITSYNVCYTKLLRHAGVACADDRDRRRACQVASHVRQAIQNFLSGVSVITSYSIHYTKLYEA